MKNKKSRLGIFVITLVFAMAVITCDSSGNGTSSEPIGFYVGAKPGRGFNYGYYYYIPGNVTGATYLLVETNNSERVSDVMDFHAERAQMLIRNQSWWADQLGVALLVPVFPRPRTNGLMYTHALDRDTLLNNTGDLARIDLQLIAMIDDFRELCQSKGISVASKVLMNGFSASANFANRFTAIHPGRVQAVATGGVNCMPILPVNALGGENLIFPIGIYDIGTITGTPFNLAQYRTVPQFIYMGALDNNDTLPFDDAFGDEERRIITRVLGSNMFGRWQPSQDVYRQQGCSAVIFRTYPGVGHQYTNEIIQDIFAFFRSNM